MPLPFLLLIGIGAATAVVVRFWDRILNWAQGMFLPWVDKHLPFLAPYARHAFTSMHGVIADVRRTIRDAWRALRTRLVAQMVEFTRDVDNRWIVSTTSWIIASLSPQEDHEVIELQEKRNVALKDLPPEVVERWVQQNENTITFDLTQIRDKEVMDMKMEDEE
ncbi:MULTISPECIES: hypothetical protein [Streptomyces]|uniref:Uncharacterized protein n=2 Tax=Streptomyces TaxID=1883 RepID=A0ABV2USY2_9ACTN|nr:hypothetical protein [Streptomyces indiaensis]MCF1648488.1 hypothetical protein [Streptomyces indiaensis]